MKLYSTEQITVDLDKVTVIDKVNKQYNNPSIRLHLDNGAIYTIPFGTADYKDELYNQIIKAWETKS